LIVFSTDKVIADSKYTAKTRYFQMSRGKKKCNLLSCTQEEPSYH